MADSASAAARTIKGLDGVRVLELGEGVSASHATKLLADLGADVVKVEPREGDRTRSRGPFPNGQAHSERSGLFLALNANKRSIALDLQHPDDRAVFHDLASRSDAVVHNLSPASARAAGVDFAQLEQRRPGLVVTSITPFGSTGPYRDYAAEDLTISNAGGWAYLSPGASEETDEPPLKPFGHQSELQAGLAGSLVTLAALHRAARTGQGEHIDLSAQAYVASFLEAALVTTTYAGLQPTRFGRRGLNPWKIFECSDGLIFLATIEQDQWERLVEFMGNPEWAELEILATFKGRLENADVVESFVQEWVAPWTVDALYREGQKRRICFAPVLTMQQLSEQDHLHAREYFVDVAHADAGVLTHLGAPYRLREPWWAVRRGAPRLDQHGESLRDELRSPAPPGPTPPARSSPDELSPRPLEGVRIADFTWVWAGPFAAMQLAHLGAEVIKVESEGRPDLGRRLPIHAPGVEPSLDASGYFNQWNQGKKSLRLDLSKPAARDVALRLIGSCDAVIDNFATGVMDRLGLGYEALRAIRPDLITASISGYGDEGPRRNYMAYGPAIGPLSGLSSLTGYVGGAPRELGVSLGDPTAGITAAVAICAALLARERAGGGQHIDVSLWESTAALSIEGWMDFAMNGSQPDRCGNRDACMSPHGCFPCAGDDEWVSIACADEAKWAALCATIDGALARDSRFATATDRKRNETALEARIAAWTRERDRFEVTHQLQAAGVAAFPSLSTVDVTSDPQLEARGFLERLDHPVVGRRIHAGIPWLLTRASNGVRTPAPCLGEHTHEVLRDLGYSDAEVRALEHDGVLS